MHWKTPLPATACMVARIGVLPLMPELVTCTTQHVVRHEKENATLKLKL